MYEVYTELTVFNAKYFLCILVATIMNRNSTCIHYITKVHTSTQQHDIYRAITVTTSSFEAAKTLKCNYINQH